MNNRKLRLRAYLAELESGTRITARQLARTFGCTSAEAVAGLRGNPDWVMQERINHEAIHEWVKQ